MNATLTAELGAAGYLRSGVLHNMIDGEWQDAAAGGRTEDLDPATGEPLLEVAESTPEDATAALQAAVDAQASWAATSIFQRAQVVLTAARLLRERAAAIGRIMTMEEGKPLPEAIGETVRTAETLEAFAGLVHRPKGEVHHGHRPGEQWTMTMKVPLGAVIVLSPWNFPLMIPAWKTTAALITGNTVVLKPAEPSPLTAATFVGILEEAGLPAGVVNLLIGRGSNLGPTLLRKPAAAVSLTGGNAAGKVIGQAALEHGLKYQLELGGNNPVLVLQDADLDLATRELVAGAVGSTGQKCTATRRVFVEDAVFDDVLQRFEAALRRQRLGPGVEEDTDVGPLVTAGARDELESSVAEAVDAGADVRRFGELPGRGFFVQPTLVVDPDPAAPYVRRENFGPMVSLMRVSGLDDGLERCNETEYGLSASLFTRDIGNAIRFADGIQAGMVHVNSQTTGAEPHMPFGGMKASSNFSRELGEHGLDWFTQVKALYVEGVGGAGR